MIFVVGLALLALIGVPVFAVLGAAALIASLELREVSPAIPAIDVFDAKFAYDAKLAAIPLFAFAGCVLGYSGAPRRVWRLSQAWLGWLPAGLALAAVPTAAFLAAFAGGTGPGASRGLLLPALLGAGYSERFAAPLVTASGAIGFLFAPSLALLLYGSVAGLVMQGAVVAGIVPALLALGLLVGYVALAGGRRQPVSEPFRAREAVAALLECKWELALVVLLIGTVAGGLVRLHEAAALTALYVLAVGVLVHGDVDLRRDLPRGVVESAATVGAVLLVLAIAIGVFVLVVQGELLLELTSWMRGRVHSTLLFLLIANALLLVVGMAIDAFTAIAIVMPLIVRLAEAYGVDPYHLTAIVLLNLAIGGLTRPIAHDFLLASPRSRPRTREPHHEASWIGALLAALLVVTCVPALATWLPNRIVRSAVDDSGISSVPCPTGDGEPLR